MKRRRYQHHLNEELDSQKESNAWFLPSSLVALSTFLHLLRETPLWAIICPLMLRAELLLTYTWSHYNTRSQYSCNPVESLALQYHTNMYTVWMTIQHHSSCDPLVSKHFNCKDGVVHHAFNLQSLDLLCPSCWETWTRLFWKEIRSNKFLLLEQWYES